MSSAPIAIFAYKRPDALAQLLKSIEACPEASDSKIFLFVDGPRGDADKAAVGKVIEVAKKTAIPVQIDASDVNRGLRKSIVRGVSQLTEKFGSAIVLEDDLVLAPTALRYFNDALQDYRDNEQVWSVSGFMYDTPALKGRDECLFLPYAHPWGWATWERAWSQFKNENVDDALLKSKAFKRAMSMYGLANFADMLYLNKSQMINSWFVEWYRTIVQRGGVSVFPPVTQVQNGGIGGAGATHGSALNPHKLLVGKAELAASCPAMPSEVAIDFIAIDAIVNSMDARAHRIENFGGSIKRKLRRK